LDRERPLEEWLFLLDHSIVFDGGYRVYLGQVPYRDIYMPYLPGALWFQAPFGTLQHEQLGFAFVLLALVAVVEADGAGLLRMLCPFWVFASV
jgi:hypothetical protein